MFLLFFTACGASENYLLQDQEQGDLIAAAIHQYDQDKGAKPQDLEDLVPEYLSNIPTPKSGGSFVYSPSPTEGYSLCFPVRSPQIRGQTRCCYHQRLQVWDCTAGD